MGNKIAVERKMQGLDQAELATKIGSSSKSISNWETEQNSIPSEKIKAMCKLFGCTADWLLGIDNDKRTA